MDICKLSSVSSHLYIEKPRGSFVHNLSPCSKAFDDSRPVKVDVHGENGSLINFNYQCVNETVPKDYSYFLP